MTNSRGGTRLRILASSFQSFLIKTLLYGFAKVNPQAADSNERNPPRLVQFLGVLRSSVTSYVSSDQMARDVIHVAIDLIIALIH
ncbi:hypothetical protein [Arthrobacter sp. H-02-3]|uniref:hypothetical protein n=1 Tax=Arthrobacter sp. H-02-3 TaxID=2703675 RepID=UPI000DD2A0A6|nr:hypothetical protein [Arthrobacter sp. H-02-3]PVZ58359.1 hypothetical protein C9424_06750 [Arthrobacter sp. H-02-3]